MYIKFLRGPQGARGWFGGCEEEGSAIEEEEHPNKEIKEDKKSKGRRQVGIN